MAFLGELRVRATLENLRTITDFVQSIGARLALQDKTLFQLDLAVEEAASNIVQHAYAPGAAGDLLLRAETTGNAVQLALTDWGVPFDPDTAKPFDIHAPIETRMKGGMGLYFIERLMDGVQRHTTPEPGGPNTLIMVKRYRLDPEADDTRGGSDATLAERGAFAERMGTQRELNAMLTVSQGITADVELDDLLVLIINELVQAIDAERGAIYLFDLETDELYSRVLSTDSGD